MTPCDEDGVPWPADSRIVGRAVCPAWPGTGNSQSMQPTGPPDCLQTPVAIAPFGEAARCLERSPCACTREEEEQPQGPGAEGSASQTSWGGSIVTGRLA